VHPCGECWIVERSVPVAGGFTKDQALTFAFIPRLIGTRTCEEAMWLAEYCDAIPREPVAGYWADVGNVRAR
jgi:hypothetical protein